MSEQDYSKNGLLKHLKQSAVSGLLNPAVARSRKTAAEQLLSYVTPEERLNLKLLDVDELCSRIHKLEDSSIRFEALNLYNSRLKSALADYFAWIENPDSFISNSGPAKNSIKTQKLKNTAEERALEEITLRVNSMQEDIIPIPIREDLVVFIKDLPLNLTHKEADKIIRIIKAYAEEKDNSGESSE
jgi:hypothetical protein